MTDINNPTLWKKENEIWKIVDQSNKGKDFWQVDYNSETDSYDLIFN